MNYRNYSKTILKHFLFMLIYALIISLLYFLKIFNYKTIRIINYIVNLLLFFTSGYKIASLEQKKGYLNGFLISIIIILFFIIISLFISKLNFISLVYYLSLITSSIIGGIIGVTKKTK
jgi:putative membrane protein (TIGR04086 family)